MLTKSSHGLILGKFMPLHLGHEYLIRFASLYTPKLSVVVDSLANQTLPVSTRVAWIQELFPRAQVIGLTQNTPKPLLTTPNSGNFGNRRCAPLSQSLLTPSLRPPPTPKRWLTTWKWP